MRNIRRRAFCSVTMLGVLAIGTAFPAGADPNALWSIVHDRCVPDYHATGDPAPCAMVDTTAGDEAGYAILKDQAGATQFLVIPTGRVSGIEDHALVQPNVTNYFAAAWTARRFVDQRAAVDVPRTWISLALNSKAARTQEQLHIHIDCVRSDVRQTLDRHVDELSPTWTPFPEPLAGEPYLAMTVEGEELTVDPINLVADGVADARNSMDLETIAVVGTYLADGEPGFILLAGRADPAIHDVGGAERLQDHSTCPPPRVQPGR